MSDRQQYFRDYHQRRQKNPEYRARKCATATAWYRRKQKVKRLLALPQNEFLDAYMAALAKGEIRKEDFHNGKEHQGRRGARGKGVALARTFDRRAAYARGKAAPARD